VLHSILKPARDGSSKTDGESSACARFAVARLICRLFEGIVAWTQTRQTNAFIQALNVNGLFQAAKRKARGHTRFATMRTALFPIAGKLDYSSLNPHLKPGRRALSPNSA
jgi:hypothetical protein